MTKSIQSFLLFILSFWFSFGQSTDLSIVIEAQDLTGNSISQIDLFENFQYVVTLQNSGIPISDANVSITFDPDLVINSFNSQNNSGGASSVSDLNLTNNILTGLISNMPGSSSVELLVLVSAPGNPGGIAIDGTINPPEGIEDSDLSNNQSIISIDVLDSPVDVSISQEQISPVPGIPLEAWGDEVTYRFTMTNNSSVSIPVSGLSGELNLSSSPLTSGEPVAAFVSLNCISGTNGTTCPEDLNTVGETQLILIPDPNFISTTYLILTPGGSITFEVVYLFLNAVCSSNPQAIEVSSTIRALLGNSNSLQVSSNSVDTTLLEPEACLVTDLCIETVITAPDPAEDLIYGQNLTFSTSICNNGPTDSLASFYSINLGQPNLEWEIVSVDCQTTTGSILCSDIDINLSDNQQSWISNDVLLPANSTIVVETMLRYLEPECYPTPEAYIAQLRSVIQVRNPLITDLDLSNNIHDLFLELPASEPLCGFDPDLTGDLRVTKVQVNPELPIGSGQETTAAWGEVTYEITVENVSENDAFIELQDHMPVPIGDDTPINAMLIAVDCIDSTGTAECFSIQNANTGVVLDGVTEDGTFDTFWEILPEDNWALPANSSVTFSVTVDWQPECSEASIIGTNVVRVNYTNLNDINTFNNKDEVETYFAPCIDLVVQTFPEFTQVDTGQSFNWIVDISNSNTSSGATNIYFENTLNSAFLISGPITCNVSSGTATCLADVEIVGSTISGTLPGMEAGSTVSISIPVTAPNFGGAFNNIAEAIPNISSNRELTPETNISINSVQVIAPVLDKFFLPDTIFEGNESELIFTVFNIASNPAQSAIAFMDNLPEGVFLVSEPSWIEANGCTANFIGASGDTSVGVSNLNFPENVQSCSFSVVVSSNNSGIYLNNSQNFSSVSNLDTSQTSAVLNVIVDTTDVDIAVSKTVDPEEVSLGDEVTFTITAFNMGTTQGTSIEILDLLPSGYSYISNLASSGSFDETSYIWSIDTLSPGVSETLEISTIVNSSLNLNNVAFLNGLNEIDRDSSNNQDEAEVIISNCLRVPQGISPNGDQRNDTFKIPCIEDYPNNRLQIYNRYGYLVYESHNYNNSWDGSPNKGFPSNTGKLPVGTYYYILELRDLNRSVMGYVYLNY